MRWPLRYQILLPLVLVTLATLLATSVLSAWFTARRTKLQIERQLAEAAKTLEQTNFPLTDMVLKQTRGLSGAEYVVTDLSNDIRAHSNSAMTQLPPNVVDQNAKDLRLDQSMAVDGVDYFYAAIHLDRRRVGGGEMLLHVYYPEQSWREARNAAVLPPLVIGSVALLILVAVAVAIAARVTRPVAELQRQVEQIAAGHFEPMKIPQRDDEIRDLRKSVNRMAELLASYEEQMRRSERLHTLGQLGGAVAHQMRNAATGCRMALDLHARDCPLGEDNEDLEVATRQLSLMEKYLRRFLATGAEFDGQMASVDLVALVNNVLSLVRPSALHIGARLEFVPPRDSIPIVANSDSLEQMLINLVLNAIEETHGDDALVAVSIIECADDQIRIEVKDTGPGPPADIGETLFDPLVSGKKDGAGLGLAIVRDIIQQHGGKVYWERRDAMTCFVVELPRTRVEEQHGSLVDR